MISKIFSPKRFAKKLAFFSLSYCEVFEKNYHIVGFFIKAPFFRRKLAKIAGSQHRPLEPIHASKLHTCL
jgi:hypothetical protein